MSPDPARVALGATVLVVVLLLSGLSVPWLLVYLGFVLATILVVRSVPQEPGALLGRRLARRTMVMGIFAVCAALSLPTSPTWVFLLFVALVLLNVALGRATRHMAAAPEDQVDEREESLRNRAHRYAYWLFALFLGGTLLVGTAGGPGARSWLDEALRAGGFTIVAGQLLLFLPAMTLAWLEPDRLAPEGSEGHATRTPWLAIAMVTAAVTTPLILSVSIAVAPVRTTTKVTQALPTLRGPCGRFEERKTVGLGVGAVLHLDGVVCWDGRQATERYGFNNSDCAIFSGVEATVSSVACTRKTDRSGALHFTDTRIVRSDLVPWIKREVTLQLTVDRNGLVGDFQ